MTITDKHYIACLACTLIDHTTDKGIQIIIDILNDLQINFEDVMQVMHKGDKKGACRALREMNREDKKLAQQYLLRAFINGGKRDDFRTAAMLNEILEECNMFDNVI